MITYSNLTCRMWRIVTLLFVLQIASCASPTSSFTCSDIEQSPLRALDYGVDDPPTVLQKVADAFPLQQSDLTYEPYDEDPDSGVAVWDASTYGSYNAMFRNGVVTKVYLFFDNNRGPRMQQVLDCLGKPAKYLAVYKPDIENQFQLSLWYPDRGMVALSTKFGGARPPSVTGDTQVSALSFQRPGSIEEMIAAEFGYVHQDLLQSLKPWPGSLDRIVVDNLLPK